MWILTTPSKRFFLRDNKLQNIHKIYHGFPCFFTTFTSSLKSSSFKQHTSSLLFFSTSKNERNERSATKNTVSPFRYSSRKDTACKGEKKSHNDKSIRICFMTDVEGDRDYFDRFVDNSQVLKFIQKKKKNNEYYRQVVFQHDEVNSIFVYGGDVCDKGGSDLYILEQLLNFRELYPDRVFFLLGNRDINKIRITQEIQQKKHDGCWWFKGLNVIGDPLHSNSSNKRIPCDQIERLKWMLKSTMGSPDAFQFRLEELDTVTSTSAVKEKDVLESYLNICRPDGLFGQYIKHAHLILKIDDILFMHGGLPITNIIIQQQLESSSKNHNLWDDFSFATPWLVKESTQTIKKKKKKITFQEWIDMLHDFKTTEYHAWESKFKKTKEIDEEDRKLWCTRGGYEDTRDGEALMQYGMFSMPTGDHKEENPTVVYSSWLYDGMPKMFDTSQKMYQEILQDFFNTTRIKLILTGHKPHGDCALPMKVNHNSGNSWIISADTSYSGDTVWLNSIDQMQNDKKVNIGRQSSKSGRGLQSFCEVLVDYDLSSINQFKHSVEESPSSTDLKSIQFHGVLSDGTRYLSKNLLDENHNHHLGNVIHLKQNEDTKKENLFGDDANHEKNKSIPSSPKTIEDLDQVCVKLKFDTMSGSKSNEADGNEDKYLVSYSKGYDVWNAIVSLSQDKL